MGNNTETDEAEEIADTPEAPCGVRPGNVVKIGGQYQVPFKCPAIVLVEATGVKYMGELGKSDVERTHVVRYIRATSCERILLKDGTCPAMR